MICEPLRCGSSLVTKLCPTLATPWTVAHQAPLSMGFSRQEYWSGLPFPCPGDLPDPGTEPGSPASQADSLPTELQGKPLIIETGSQIHHCLLLGACLLTPDLSLDAILFTQFVHKITEEEAKKEIWSSVNYLFLIFTSLVYGKNQHGKLSIVWSKDLKVVLWLEMSRRWGHLA